MFEELRLINLDNSSLSALTIPLFGATEYRIKYIDGLNPAPANIVTSEYGFIEGSAFQSAKTQQRNIVLTVGFNPNYGSGQTITDLRRDLYSYLPSGGNVELQFIHEGGTYRIRGYVETHESSIFTEAPLSQISIICPNPYFEEVGSSYSITVPSVEPEDWPLYWSAEVEVEYTGTHRTGGVFSLDGEEGRPDEHEYSPPQPTVDYRIHNVTTNQTMTIKLDRGDYDIGDFVIPKFQINTTPGSKSVLVDGNSSLDSLTQDSSWIELTLGTNLIQVTSLWEPAILSEGSVYDFTVSWVPLHGGL